MIGLKRAPVDTPENQIADLRREIESLREYIERQSRMQEAATRALLAHSVASVAESLEPRIRLATREAMAYAEQGLEQHEAALRAMGRRLAERGVGDEPAPSALFDGAVGAHPYIIGADDPEAGDSRRLALRRDSETDFFADLENLAILPGGASRLMAAHIVEYVPAATLRERVLPFWRSRLALGGELVIVTLDGPAWSAGLARVADDFEALRLRLGADGAGRPPRTLFDGAGLARILIESGFVPEAPTSTPPTALRISARARLH